MCSILFNEKKGMKVIIGIEMQIFKDNGGVSNYSIFLRMEFVNEQRLGPHFSGHFTLVAGCSSIGIKLIQVVEFMKLIIFIYFMKISTQS